MQLAMQQKIALIGYGAIGAAVHRLLLTHADHVEVVAVLVRDSAVMQALAPQAAELLVDNLSALLQRSPSLVIECAGHQAVDLYGVAVLQAGLDLLLVSIGALAEPAREAALVQGARAAGKRLLLPAGAIGGVDWLAAARLAGLYSVTYRSRKPPQAWAGSAAAKQLDLAAMTEAVTFFRGSARQAALQYPRNANVAATVALAGLGFEDTAVEMIADPHVSANVHEIEADGAGGQMCTRLAGLPDLLNPRTSVMTAHSVVRCILHETATVVI
jgi:aspartate dehydrogenase